MRVTSTPNPAGIESPVTLRFIAHNRGPATATNVVVTGTLATDEFFVNSITTPQGSCSQAGAVVTCNLGTMAVDTTVIVVIAGFNFSFDGGFTPTADVVADQRDPLLGNNHSVEITSVIE